MTIRSYLIIKVIELYGTLLYVEIGCSARSTRNVCCPRNARSACSACNARNARKVRSAPGARSAGNALSVRSARRSTGAPRIAMCCNKKIMSPAHGPRRLVRIYVARVLGSLGARCEVACYARPGGYDRSEHLRRLASVMTMMVRL